MQIFAKEIDSVTQYDGAERFHNVPILLQNETPWFLKLTYHPDGLPRNLMQAPLSKTNFFSSYNVHYPLWSLHIVDDRDSEEANAITSPLELLENFKTYVTIEDCVLGKACL